MITGPLSSSYIPSKIKRLSCFCKHLMICNSEESAWCIKDAKSIIDRSSWKKLSINGYGHVLMFGYGYCNIDDRRAVNECFEQHVEPAELKEIK
jgi:hypothetical protein